jgi:cyclic pyranopterin phosphate synthase
MSTLSHLNSRGEAAMVDVGAKEPTRRKAVAMCEIVMKAATLQLLRNGKLEKGDAFAVARVAGILTAKKTHDLIPLCHPLPLEHIEVRFFDRSCGPGILIEVEVNATAKTGVEMEALAGAAIAALTLYDMAKASDPGMAVRNLHVVKKTGGKSDFHQSRYPYGE